MKPSIVPGVYPARAFGRPRAPVRVVVRRNLISHSQGEQAPLQPKFDVAGVQSHFDLRCNIGIVA